MILIQGLFGFLVSRLIAVGLFIVLWCGGCVSAVQDMWKPNAPHTKAAYGAFSGFSFDDTKNNDVDIQANYNSTTGDYSVKAKIRNNASEVNESLVPLMQQFIVGLGARVAEMDARTREQAQVGENVQKSLAEIRGMLGTVMAPLTGASVDIDGPLGKGGIKTGGALKPIEAIEPIVPDETTDPATAPPN